MQAYIDQLLADLRERHDKQPPPVDYRLLHPQYADVPEELRYVVEWENAPEQTFEELFGISAEAFPPAEQLSETQMEAIVEGVLSLWKGWRMYATVPEKAPIASLYRVLTNYWREETICYVSEGDTHLEFCEYDTENCPWGSAHCTCKDFLDIDDSDERRNTRLT